MNIKLSQKNISKQCQDEGLVASLSQKKCTAGLRIDEICVTPTKKRLKHTQSEVQNMKKVGDSFEFQKFRALRENNPCHPATLFHPVSNSKNAGYSCNFQQI